MSEPLPTPQIHNNGPWGSAYTDRELGHLRGELHAEVRLLTQRMDATERALELQAAEYARRLDVLNHAHEEARLVASETVTREKFDAYKATQDAAFDTYKAAQEDKSAVATRANRMAIIAVAGMLLTLALEAVRWFRQP